MVIRNLCLLDKNKCTSVVQIVQGSPDMCVCVCVKLKNACVHVLPPPPLSLSLSLTDTHTHTHTHIYIYIYKEINVHRIFFRLIRKHLKKIAAIKKLFKNNLKINYNCMNNMNKIISWHNSNILNKNVIERITGATAEIEEYALWKLIVWLTMWYMRVTVRKKEELRVTMKDYTSVLLKWNGKKLMV